MPAFLASRSEFITVRGLRYHLRHWGREGAPMLFMVDGWMDVSASFQFLVEALKQEWHVIAPDWRGYGLTDWPTRHPGADCYWFPDYLGDLDALLDHACGTTPVNLIGHSMGGNVVLSYAGIRPQRIRRLINLEGFGLPDTVPAQAPGRLAKWLDALREGESMRSYDSIEAVAQRLQKTNPRLSAARASFLAPHWASENAAGKWEICGDPAHKLINPSLYRLAEAQACWSRITAPVLHVEALDTDAPKWLAGGQGSGATSNLETFSMDQFRVRFDVIANRRDAFIADAGHMLHHDQPEQVAELIETFCAD